MPTVKGPSANSKLSYPCCTSLCKSSQPDLLKSVVVEELVAKAMPHQFLQLMLFLWRTLVEKSRMMKKEIKLDVQVALKIKFVDHQIFFDRNLWPPYDAEFDSLTRLIGHRSVLSAIVDSNVADNE